MEQHAVEVKEIRAELDEVRAEVSKASANCTCGAYSKAMGEPKRTKAIWTMQIYYSKFIRIKQKPVTLFTCCICLGNKNEGKKIPILLIFIMLIYKLLMLS